MTLDIERSQNGFCCFFKHNGNEYFADLSYIKYVGNECMIFSSENGKVCWSDLYCKRGIPITPKALTECVEEFINQHE